MGGRRSQRPGALTHTRITWALSLMAPQVPGVTPGSALCPWCCGHFSRRGARQGWYNRDPNKIGSTWTFRAEPRGGNPSKTGTAAPTQDTPSRDLRASEGSIGRIHRGRSSQGVRGGSKSIPRHSDTNPTGPDCRAPLLEECTQHHGHKGDPGVTPGTCGIIGERAQVILV